jgi:hypothetical protein
MAKAPTRRRRVNPLFCENPPSQPLISPGFLASLRTGESFALAARISKIPLPRDPEKTETFLARKSGAGQILAFAAVNCWIFAARFRLSQSGR